MPKNCAVVGCTNNSLREWKKKFFILPSERDNRGRITEDRVERRQMWIGALHRKDLTERKIKNIRICSDHFVSGRPSDIQMSVDYVPTLKMGFANTKSMYYKWAQKRTHTEQSKLKFTFVSKEVAIVDVQPPKKKYKITRASDGKEVSVRNLSLSNALFDMDCDIEELSPSQQSRMDRINTEIREINKRIEQLVTLQKASLIYSNELTTAIEIDREVSQKLPKNIPGPPASQNYQFVMDPRLGGFLVGAVNSPPAPPLQLIAQATASIPPPPVEPKTATTTAKSKRTILKPIPSSAVTTQIKNSKPIQIKPVGKTQLACDCVGKPQLKPTPANKVARGRPPLIQTVPTLTKIVKKPVADASNKSDNSEILLNKLQGTTYPSLVVIARPHLKTKESHSQVDRSKLDVKVKSLLMYQPTKFTEWLIQQGLIKAEQKCKKHPKFSMKLGMFSDTTKFPFSGGYVWISECCSQEFAQVYEGSLFENCPHPPMVILKLIYHWCCQTIVQNVTQWVKVDNTYIKMIYSWLRAACTVATHTHIKQLGGPGVKVQVGLISLGTSQNQHQKQVKVEVLGILEPATKHIRLRAIKPLPEFEKNYKKRFTKILEPMMSWVHPQSVIVTDMTIDRASLHSFGFMNILQTTSSDGPNSNIMIMEYLRKVVPRMFQNTLAHLSHQIIQQFLDELVWREWFGSSVLQCFDNIVLHLSEQTRFDSMHSLIVRLNAVTLDPFKNWSIPLTGEPLKVQEQTAPKKYIRSRKVPQQQTMAAQSQQQTEIQRPAKSSSPDLPEQMVPLENYYYGTINIYTKRQTFTLNIKCPFCKMVFSDNLSLMDHLFKHAHNVNDNAILCRYCLAMVGSNADLEKHVFNCHPNETKFDSGFMCLICESRFMNPHILGKHMSKDHCPSELPYMCGTCNYRCSNHKQSVDHFYMQHTNGSTIQCPFCLKSTTIFSGTRNISQNMNYFVQHLQKHQRKQTAKKCNKCNLWFVHKEFLKDHQIKMHTSQRGKHGLVPIQAPRNGVMVPKSKMDKCVDDDKLIDFSALHFNVGKNLVCKECSRPMNSPKHFGSTENCQSPNCYYTTSCSSSMKDHISKRCHFINTHIPPENLPYEMFCVCGHKDTDGNLMAKHLAICERKSAYPTKEAAQKAIATNSMLDVLGLVRKAGDKPDEPEEVTEELKEEKCVDVVEEFNGTVEESVNNEETDANLVVVNETDANLVVVNKEEEKDSELS